MLNAMALSCEECGYENNPQFRFCGMCGAPLSTPVGHAVSHAAQVAPRKDTPSQPKVAPLSGPSVLGLSQEIPPATPTYLLEDEESSSNRGRYLLLILLILAAALAGWHYRQEILSRSGLASNPPAGSASDNMGSGVSPSPPQAAPAATSGSNPAEQAKTQASVADQPQAPPASTPQGTAPQAVPSQTAERATAQVHPAESSASKETASSLPQALATALPRPEARTSKPSTASKPSASGRQLAGTSGTADDSLVTEGEKYLYGNGVPEN